jgi:hypothetical protein
MHCRVKWLSTDVSEVRTASISGMSKPSDRRIEVYIGVEWRGGQWWWETIGWERANGSGRVEEVEERERYIDRGCEVDATHPWWWRQYAPLKRRSTIILHGSTTQKTTLNKGYYCFISYCILQCFAGRYGSVWKSSWVLYRNFVNGMVVSPWVTQNTP